MPARRNETGRGLVCAMHRTNIGRFINVTGGPAR